MKQFYSCFFGFFLWALPAQDIVVVDETNSEPISGAVVYNLVKTKTNISNFDGIISIADFQSFEKIYFLENILEASYQSPEHTNLKKNFV